MYIPKAKRVHVQCTCLYICVPTVHIDDIVVEHMKNVGGSEGESRKGKVSTDQATGPQARD